MLKLRLVVILEMKKNHELLTRLKLVCGWKSEHAKHITMYVVPRKYFVITDILYRSQMDEWNMSSKSPVPEGL